MCVHTRRLLNILKPDQNATIWTGGEDGKQVVYGDILLDRGIITKVGQISRQLTGEANLDAYNHIDAQGKWVSPG